MGRLTAWKWLSHQFTKLPPLSELKVDLAGKTIIITGGSTGLGLATARHFATMNPGRIILACRNEIKGSTAASSIRESTGFQAVEAWVLDLASFTSIKAFADRFEREGGGHVDILVENAGALFTTYAQTQDGWERSLQVNHLGPSFLALLLLPYLLKAPSSYPTPRLILVASESHYFVSRLTEADSPKILEKLNDEEYCTKINPKSMGRRYPVSKLMNNFFTRSLASRLPAPPTGALTVACVHPGFCRTDLLGYTLGIVKFLMLPIEMIFARTSAQGARTVVWASLGGKPGEVHGRYTASCAVEEESDFILSKEGSDVEERLWKETLEILSKRDARIQDIVQSYLSNH